jgi:tetratricopeptide (TPR) repeat protein
MFITGGIITALAWILFFGTFIFAGLKLVTRKISNPSVSYLSVSFYLMALYLWLVSIFYVPQFTMFIFAGITTGAFISISNIAGFAKNKKIELQKKTYKRYLVTIGLVCVIVLSLYTASSVGTRAGAFVYLKQSTNSIASADIAAAESYLEQANLLYHGAAGDQVQANISLLKLGLAEELRQQGVSVDENQTADEINRAINSARSAVGKNPRSYANWLLLAGVYEGLIRYGVENAGSNAQDAYIAAQKLSPQDPSIRLRKARLEIMLGNNDAAREYINNAIDLKEDYVGAYYVLSQLEITEDNIGEAIIATEQSVLLAPSNPTFLFQLGILLYSAQEYEKTILVLERLLSIRNDYANALYYIGLAYEFEGQQEKTIEAFLKIKLLNPDNLHVQDIISSLQEGGTAREVVEAGGPNAISQVVDLEESLPESDEINL